MPPNVAALWTTGFALDPLQRLVEDAIHIFNHDSERQC